MSATSLAILEAEVYEDETFRRQLRDAVSSLAVGPNWNPVNMVTPLTQPPSPNLRQALCSLDTAETWLLQPEMIEGNPQLWSPGIKLNVAPNSFFSSDRMFWPVLGLMRAENLTHAIELANQVSYGLTTGLHSLDDREVEQWQETIDGQSLYQSTHDGGNCAKAAIWRLESVCGRAGAKAGGPNYLLQLGSWQQVGLPAEQMAPDQSVATFLAECTFSFGSQGLFSAAADRVLSASVQSYAWAWQHHLSQAHDPSQVLGEKNLFRYRPCPIFCDSALGLTQSRPCRCCWRPKRCTAVDPLAHPGPKRALAMVG